MTTTAKSLKDKPYGCAPRLTPRPTAASAARAARNATNRNVTQQPSQQKSPTRTPVPPSFTKGRSVLLCNDQKSDSKTSVKVLEKLEDESYIDHSEFVVKTEEHAEEGNVGLLNDFHVQKENHSLDYGTRSQPQTPAPSSRPQTPKNASSRPQTPCTHSRPSTPARASQRQAAPGSRPNTPQHGSRPRTPLVFPFSPKVQVLACHMPCSPNNNENDVKSMYSAKQKQFLRMKKELDLKQQAVLELFDCLRVLRERMCREGMTGSGEGVQQQELVVFNVADWATEEIAQLCRDASASACSDGAVELINSTVPLDECALVELDEKVMNIPTRFAELCLQAFNERQELIDWVKELLENNEGRGDEFSQRIARYNLQGLELCETLRELKCHTDDAVHAVTQLSRRVYQERSALLAVGETLVREVARLRQDLEDRATIVNEMREIRAETETARVLEDTRRELEEERAARAATKDKLATTESQLRQTRLRVTKMDRQLREAEASIASLTGTVKSLEDQSRQREVQLEARARKLKESLKTGEIASSHLTQQKDSLHAEVQELKEQIEAMTSQHKSIVQDLNNQLKELKSDLEEQKQITQKEIEIKEAAVAAVTENLNLTEELKTRVTELENSRPNPELPTEREMDLWAELQATKDTLRITEEEITVCKREKVRFLETFTKITESDNKVGVQQKFAAELLSKEEIISKMQIQIRELTKNIKLNEQKVIQYEQYVRALQTHNCTLANCEEAPNGITYQDLQKENLSLRMGLLEAAHRNEELSEMLLQKEQQLEQQDKTSRAQARVIKVREELINMLKNKETEQSRELAVLQQDLEHRMKIVDEVNKQIAAKADEIQELFATLENKQQQIHRLEKIVLALEEQQRRAQAQRTRHEEKIAALEHELAAGGNRRERKFLFF